LEDSKHAFQQSFGKISTRKLKTIGLFKLIEDAITEITELDKNASNKRHASSFMNDRIRDMIHLIKVRFIFEVHQLITSSESNSLAL